MPLALAIVLLLGFGLSWAAAQAPHADLRAVHHASGTHHVAAGQVQ
jgi:hypothetical protein